MSSIAAGSVRLERTTLAKVTRRLLPFLFVLYIVCFLDRVNVGFAALQMNHARCSRSDCGGHPC
jgi:hypothetical protein